MVCDLMDQIPEQLKKRILDFRDARDWSQFHSPKNLAEGLSVEAGELLENFLWMTSEQSRNPDGKQLTRIKHELADIFVFMVYICHELDIDLFAETEKKICLNELKYPVEKSRGNSTKYTDL